MIERALITGASSGIGEALARLLSNQGIKLILSGRNKTRLEEIGDEVKAEKIVVADLLNRDQRKELIRVIRAYIPDLVINNAGYGIYGDALSISVEEQLGILEVNGEAPLELTLEAIRALVGAEKRGVIMNVSSVAGEHPCPGMSVYGAAKSFLTHVSQALNTELSSKGVNILVSCPGMVATDFANRAAKRAIKIDRKILTPQFAAEQIWKQITKRKEKHIFNWQYRLGSYVATHLIPVSLIKKMIWKQIKQRV